MGLPMVAHQLRRDLGDAAVITDPVARRTYECDGLTSHRCTPGVVVWPEDAEGVRAAVLACREAGVPFVARGSGPSAGALPEAAGVLPEAAGVRPEAAGAPPEADGGPPEADKAPPEADGVLIVTERMRRIIEVDLPNRRAVVEPGVLNLAFNHRVGPTGYFYAPDQSSRQLRSFGRGVAENSGGPHCVKYGFTTQHVSGLEVCTPDGDLVRLGVGKAVRSPGYDLTGLFIGSQGTLGIATKIVVKLLRAPESARTILAAFDSVDRAGTAARAITAAGVQPAAAEVMEAPAIRAAEAAADCGYPAGTRAVLIVELHGPAVEVEAETAAVTALFAGALELRTADDPAGRAAIWRGRESAVGRLREDHLVGSISGEAGAGGGTSARRPGESSIDDLSTMRDDLATMRLVRRAFDPSNRANPGKVFPTPRLCGERSPAVLAPCRTGERIRGAG